MKEPLPDTVYGNLVTRVSVFLNIVYIAVNEIDRIFQSFLKLKRYNRMNRHHESGTENIGVVLQQRMTPTLRSLNLMN